MRQGQETVSHETIYQYVLKYTSVLVATYTYTCAFIESNVESAAAAQSAPVAFLTG